MKKLILSTLSGLVAAGLLAAPKPTRIEKLSVGEVVSELNVGTNAMVTERIVNTNAANLVITSAYNIEMTAAYHNWWDETGTFQLLSLDGTAGIAYTNRSHVFGGNLVPFSSSDLSLGSVALPWKNIQTDMINGIPVGNAAWYTVGTNTGQLATWDALTGQVAAASATLQSQIMANGNTLTDHAGRIDEARDNIYLNTFRIQVSGDLTQQSMQGGVIDEFEDQTGVDLGTGSNYTYSAAAYSWMFYSWDVSTNELAAHYKLNDNAGTALIADSSVYGKTGTYTDVGGDVATSTGTGAGKVNAAITLDGGDERIVTSFSSAEIDAVLKNSWTIAYWIKLADGQPATANQFTYFYRAGSVHYHALVAANTSGQMYWGCRVDSVSNHGTTGAVWPNGATDWGHQVWVYDEGVSKRVYFNGAEQTLSNSNAPSADNFFQDYPFVFGCDPVTPGSYINGQIDDVRVYTRALSADDIADLYASGVGTEANGGESGGNMLLQSTGGVYAASVPTTARLISLVTDTDADLVINTDYLAWVSSDGGSTWDSVTLSDMGPYDGDTRIWAGDATLTGGGTNIKWRVTTDNQKDGALEGQAVMWR